MKDTEENDECCAGDMRIACAYKRRWREKIIYSYDVVGFWDGIECFGYATGGGYSARLCRYCP
jgi:hypothetical protein